MRKIRHIAALGVCVIVAAGMSACGPTRSIDAYCGVMEKHKDRFVTATNQAMNNSNVFESSVQMVSAMGDLSAMFDEAAEVAPEEIAPDVERVAEYWSTQQATAEQMVTDPFAGLAGALTGGMMNSGSLMRVDDYTAANCPTVGRMF